MGHASDFSIANAGSANPPSARFGSVAEPRGRAKLQPQTFAPEVFCKGARPASVNDYSTESISSLLATTTSVSLVSSSQSPSPHRKDRR